ncbi:MarR family winged helix-turn-helix transcriptional regulator [Thalassotalea fusca]
MSQHQNSRKQAFELSKVVNDPIDLLSHLPFRIAVVSNLLALNRDWKIRNLCDLDPREMRVLINIGSYMPIKSADIAYQSRLDSYTVSRAVKKLIALNLVESVPDKFKKNVKNLVLNEQGLVLYQALNKALVERGKLLDSALTEQELIQFYAMLDKIEAKSEQMLAKNAKLMIAQGLTPPADQKEIIRWHKKSTKK